MSLALLQLLREQTTQKLVPVLALKLAKVLHLAAPKTAARSVNLLGVARQASLCHGTHPA